MRRDHGPRDRRTHAWPGQSPRPAPRRARDRRGRRPPSTAQRVAAVIALVLPLIAIVAFVLLHRPEDGAAKARAAASAFAAAWSRGDDARAGGLTDAAGAATEALKANRDGLDGARVTATPGTLVVKDGRASGRLRVAWQVPGIGRFAYTSPLAIAKGDDGRWLVHFSPRTIYPRLTAATRLGTARSTPARAPILDRDGHPLVRQRAVVRVGLRRDKVTDVQASAEALARVLDVDAGALARAVRGAGPKQFVEAQTLRTADYAAKRAALASVPGLLTVKGTAPLAPTRAFARALLGGVGPATAEQVNASRGKIAPGQQVGQWGLQKVFDDRLAGAPARRILVRKTDGGAPVPSHRRRHGGGERSETVLRRARGRAPRPLRTTLSMTAQRAAESALGNTKQAEALVALQPSTGDILAVANRAVADTFDRALAGAYAPGSTFKVITTAALLRAGATVDQPVACPPKITINGKTFKNFEGEQSGGATLADDFAISCNTAFVSLASRLPATALRTVAKDYGLGRRIDLALGVARSHVPPAADKVSRAAAMIGQDRIVASPLAMAGVAAAVADGRWRAPRLLASDPSKAGPQLPPGEVATLRTLMRSVVLRGTGTALATIPGEVAGKTGTAEFGGGDPPATHAWLIAYRGDLALAVLVEKGRSGGSVAAPLAARFFTAYDAAQAVGPTG